MDFNNSAHLKTALLVEGVQLDNKATEDIGQIYQEKIYSYSLTDWTTKKLVLPSDIMLEPDMFAGFRLKNDSKWAIIKKDTDKILTYQGQDIRKVDFTPRPKYYSHRTENGTPLQAIGVSCADRGVSFFVNSYCEYFKNDENCKFCSLVPSQDKFRDTLKKKSVKDVGECLDIILGLSSRIDFVQFSGGSFYNHDLESEMYMPYIKEVSSVLDKYGLKGKIPIHLTCMPPNNLELIDKLKDSGLDTISFDLEFPTLEFFNKYCPGKSKSKGYTNMRNALKYASKVLGVQNAYTIIICGIEPPKSFVKGVESLLEDGIITTLNIYHNDPLSAQNMKVSEPNVDELIETFSEISRLFKKYDVKAGTLGCAHYDIGHEIQRGLFENGTR